MARALVVTHSATEGPGTLAEWLPAAGLELVLVNPYDDAAVVDVTFVGSGDESVLVPASRGIAVPPRSRIVRPLVNWLPDRPAFALKVVAQSGRVSSAVRRSRLVNGVPSGVDWLPRAERPSDVVTLGALPSGVGERTLMLVNPGDDPALARVLVTKPDGQFVPEGLSEVVVPPRRLVQVPLTAVLQGTAAGVRVVSDGVPLLAGAIAHNQAASAPAQEIAFVAGQRPLDGPALLLDNRAGPRGDTHLLLFAPDGAAEVTITGLPVRGTAAVAVTPKVVVLKQGELQSVAISTVSTGGDVRPVVVTSSSNSAEVYGTRVITEETDDGPMVTAQAIRSQSAAGVQVPPVTHDPHAWLVPLVRPAR